MSYYTAHTLTIGEYGPTLTEVATALAEIVPPSGDLPKGRQSAIVHWEMYLEGEPFQWPQVTNHMQEVARRWPDVLFTIEGKGEDNDDLWVEYHRNGVIDQQRCEVFNPTPPPWADESTPPPSEAAAATTPMAFTLDRMRKLLNAESAMLNATVELMLNEQETLDPGEVVQAARDSLQRLEDYASQGLYATFQPLPMGQPSHHAAGHPRPPAGVRQGTASQSLELKPTAINKGENHNERIQIHPTDTRRPS